MIYLPLNIQKFASGTIDSPGTKVSGGDYMYYRINWSSVSNGSSANSSNVYADLYVRKGSYTTTGTWTGHINIGGNTSNFSHYASIGTGWVHVGSYSVPIEHNADGSKDCWIGAYVVGPSGTSAGGYSINYGEYKTLDKIPRYGTANQSLASRTETSITMNWSSDNTVDYIWYSTDNGSTWTGINVTDGKSGSYTIYNLKAKTTYKIKTRIRRKDSQLTTDSSKLDVTTYAYPYIKSASNFVVGNDNTITIYNPVKRKVAVQVQPNGASEWYGSDTTTGTSIVGYKNETWRDIWYQYCTDKTSNTYRVKLTYGTHTDTTDYSYTYTINEEANNGEVKPTFNDFEIEDTNTKTLNLTGNATKLILNYSIPKGIITVNNKAIANKYGEMSKYKMIVGEQEPVETAYNTGTVELVALQPLTTKEITMYAIDNRGFSKGVTKNVTLIDYTIPTLNLLEVKLTRSNNNIGDQVTLSFDGTYWNKNFGAKENSITKLTYRFKKTDSTQWSEEFDILENIEYNENVFRYEHLISGDLDNYGFDISESYDIIVYYQDELYGSSFNLILNSSTPNIAIAKNGNAMMQPYDEELGGALQVNGDTFVKGNLKDYEGNDLSHRVYNEQNNSQTDTYSCDYINKKVDVQNITQAGTDLNDYVESGIYFFASSSVAPTNIPAGSNGWLVVIKGDNNVHTKQIWYRYGSTNNHHQTFVRTNMNGVWKNWERFGLSPLSLYDNSSGTSGTVTLSESSADFTFLEIFYGDMGSTYGNKSIKLYSPNGKTANLEIETYTNGYYYTVPEQVLVSEKTISVTQAYRVRIKSSDSSILITENATQIKIYKVMGYK